jgi:hypothetical protein
VDVTERDMFGMTPIMLATEHRHTASVKFLQAAGASVVEKNDGGWSALLFAALLGKLSLVQYFLLEAGASIRHGTKEEYSIWFMLRLQDADPVALVSLLKVMVMLDDAPSAFVARVSLANTELITRGRHFRAKLPLYHEQQRSLVFGHCSLPPVLLSIVAEYVATTPEDMWTYGLRVEATDDPSDLV